MRCPSLSPAILSDPSDDYNLDDARAAKPVVMQDRWGCRGCSISRDYGPSSGSVRVKEPGYVRDHAFGLPTRAIPLLGKEAPAEAGASSPTLTAHQSISDR